MAIRESSSTTSIWSPFISLLRLPHHPRSPKFRYDSATYGSATLVRRRYSWAGLHDGVEHKRLYPSGGGQLGADPRSKRVRDFGLIAWSDPQRVSCRDSTASLR